MRSVLAISAVLSLLALAASHGGALHPLGDSLAVFRVPIALVCLVSVLPFWRHWRLVVPVLALVAVSLVPRISDRLKVTAAPEADIVVYQKNISFRLRDPVPLAADMIASGADVLTLQEVTTATGRLLDELAGVYPYQHRCDFSAVGDTAVASRWPAIPGRTLCAEGDGLTAMQVQSPGGPVWIVSLHLHWPYPYGQPEQVARIVPALERLEGPKIIGGDFNAVAWSETLERIETASRTRRMGHVEPTFDMGRGPVGIGIGIDHVLVDPSFAGEIRLRGLLGSDHRGVLARLSLQKDAGGV